METGDMNGVQIDTAAHVLIFPFPAQGHVTSMLKLGELLSLSGLHVTFVNSDYNHRRLTRFSAAFARLARRPGFFFRSIPDGLDDDRPRTGSRFLELEEALRTRSVGLFLDQLVTRAEPRVTCAIVDGLMPFAIEAAEGVGVPAIAFRTSSSASYWAYFCIPRLLQSGELPFPDNADLDKPIRNVPGMESLLRRRDLPSICRIARDVTDPALQFVSNATQNTPRARALIFNTTDFLEAPVLAHIRSQCPTIYAIGPLHSLLRSYGSPRPNPGPTRSISASFWQEDPTCMTWLDAQPPRSVVYVSFGSFTVVTRVQMVEFWSGLVNSGRRFLWVVRPGSVGSEDEVTKLEVAAREKGCMIVRWAPQEDVLAHSAVGCFLTHSGWNSTLEGVMTGVPMVCWPYFFDQMINSRFVSEVWGVGLDMKDVRERGVVERMVRAAMEGETAAKLGRRAAELAESGRRCVEEGGSSYEDFMKLVQHIKSLSLEARNYRGYQINP